MPCCTIKIREYGSILYKRYIYKGFYIKIFRINFKMNLVIILW